MYHAIVFLPLLGFLLAGLFPKTLGVKGCEYITTGLLMISAVLSWVAFVSVGLNGHETQVVDVLRWVNTGDFTGQLEPSVLIR